MEVFLDSLIDALKVLPFLFVLYVIIEIVETRYMSKFKANKLLKGNVAPVLGATVGLVPQCGFSVVATNLFAKRIISVGTLLAVYIATSDEAIPIILSNPDTALSLVPLLLIKLVFALAAGYGVDGVLKLINKKKEQPSEPLPETLPENKEESEDKDIGCCHHELGEKSDKLTKKEVFINYIVHPLIHSLKIFAYIFIINLIFGYIIEWIGADKLGEFAAKGSWYQPFIAGLVGLIPNCASSVIIAELYVLGGIGLGACVTGLSVNAGVAVAVLFRSNKNIKQNLLIVFTLYALAVVVGVAVSLIWN